ncbi:orotidine-5'-phosphate decarboxylase [Akkermansiaceae bacterium]|nr:orotidine-5'-phosphate decarboxylase [Akkermansiaceae bacterium]MDF1711577.1 orotidine-5'-phosphate decarboxylase [Akkermansiaceae bacterium]
MTYAERLKSRLQTTGSALCVGLDPRPDMTEGGVEAIPEFLRRVIGETSEFAAAFKPNIAYFEAMGLRGLEILDQLLGEMPKEVPVILDAKRSDIGETQKYYARSYFENWGVDAVTLNPFLGYDTLEPFLDWEGKGVYLLAVTSNPGSVDFQRRDCEGKKLFERVGELCERAESEGRKTTAGLVVGLTNADGDVLANLPDVPLLVPGLGAQGGSLDSLAGSGRKAASVINVSRGITYAEGNADYAGLAKYWADKIADSLS